MKINNLIGLVLCVCILGGCMQSTALLGPAITAGTTGNIYQAGLSYGSSHILEKETGKNSIQYVSSLMQKEIKPKIEPKGKINKDFIKLVEDQILNTRKKIFLKTN
jgi:hypothetical protein|tara:strand:+ start:362 stop:679 length:318 start_codon:yes stop_codon:yes gene_type:complete